MSFLLPSSMKPAPLALAQSLALAAASKAQAAAGVVTPSHFEPACGYTVLSDDDLKQEPLQADGRPLARRTPVTVGILQAPKGKAGKRLALTGGTSVSTVFSLDKPVQWTLFTPDNSPYYISQTATLAGITSNVALEVDLGYNFSLGQIANSSQFTSVFDQYCIKEIELFAHPQNNVVSLTNAPPLVYSAVDYDNSAASFLSALQNYPNVQVFSGLDGIRVRFKPHVALAAYSGAFTSYANKSDVWIDSASPNVNHYGWKVSLPQTSGVWNWSVSAKYLLAFRNVI